MSSISLNFLKESFPCPQTKHILSIYFHRMRGCRSMSSKILYSRSSINRTAYPLGTLIQIFGENCQDIKIGMETLKPHFEN